MADSSKKSSIAGKSSAHLVNIKRPGEVRQRLKLIFQRVSARMKLKKNGEDLNVALALMDISLSGAGFFTSRMLSKGLPVELIILDPLPKTVNGCIVWCAPMQSGMHILKFPFRAGVQFIFGSDEERQDFKNYVQQLSENHALQVRGTVRGAKVSPSEAAPIGEKPILDEATPAEETPAAAVTEEKDDEKKAA